MANMIRIKKIEYNRDISKIGDIQAVDFEIFELGKGGVVDITDKQTVNRAYWEVTFSNGASQDIFNVSRVYWGIAD